MQNNNNYSIQNLHGANKKYFLINRYRKIMISKQLEKQAVEWYYNASCHPRVTHT